MNEWEPDATCAVRTGQQQQQRQQDSATGRSPERRGVTQYHVAGGVVERAGMRRYLVLVTSPPAGQVHLPTERPVKFVLPPSPLLSCAGRVSIPCSDTTSSCSRLCNTPARAHPGTFRRVGALRVSNSVPRTHLIWRSHTEYPGNLVTTRQPRESSRDAAALRHSSRAGGASRRDGGKAVRSGNKFTSKASARSCRNATAVILGGLQQGEQLALRQGYVQTRVCECVQGFMGG